MEENGLLQITYQIKGGAMSVLTHYPIYGPSIMNEPEPPDGRDTKLTFFIEYIDISE